MEQPREIIIKDRNVETAIKEGIAILGVNKENADIIVLDRGKRGFLGLGRRMAKVKIRMKAAEERMKVN
ncbi:MAG: Jag N-terminus [Halanaerobiales bacterium]|nr:Jag N-terminus [Halanaerobiales bacterium]